MRKIKKAVDLENKKIVLDGCMITKSGYVVNLMNPDPHTIFINDIAHGLANNCRWNGHTQKFWSVAQHCCMMYDMAPEELKLTHLFHDCEEAYWGDMIKPLKNIIETKCPEITQRMRDLRKMICDKFSIPYPGKITSDNDYKCLIWEFENIIKTQSVIAWGPEKAKKEWLSRYFDKMGLKTNQIRKKAVFDFVVKHKTDCYRAFKISIIHKGYCTKEGSLLIEMARNEVGYSRKTWDGDIYYALYKTYKSIVVDGKMNPK